MQCGWLDFTPKDLLDQNRDLLGEGRGLDWYYQIGGTSDSFLKESNENGLNSKYNLYYEGYYGPGEAYIAVGKELEGRLAQDLKKGNAVVWRCTFNDFTNGGHYLLITGITEDGKVMIHDPNGENWTDPNLKDKFENGFTLRYMNTQGGQFYSYSLVEPVDIPIGQKDDASLIDEILNATGNSSELPDLKAKTQYDDYSQETKIEETET